MAASPAHARRLAHVLVFVTPALWGANYLIARWAPGVIAPHALALGRGRQAEKSGWAAAFRASHPGKKHG